MVRYMDNNSGFNAWRENRATADVQKKSPWSKLLWWIIVFLLAWWATGLIVKSHNDTTKDVVAETVPAPDLSAVPVSQIASDDINYIVRGLRVSDIELTNYARGASGVDKDKPVMLLGDDDSYIEVGLISNGAIVPVATTVWNIGENNTFDWRNSDGVSFKRNVTTDGYLIKISDEIINNSGKDVSFVPYSRIVRGGDAPQASAVDTGAIAFVNNDVESADWHDMDKKSYAYSTTTGFIGFADQYWETIVNIDRPDQTMRARKQGNTYDVDVSAGAVTVAPGATETITTHIYAGPRDQGILNMAATTIAGIDETVDYGWFWFLARPMLWALNGLDSFVGNYGIAIILFTLIVRLLMWPLTRKSYTSMAAMQKMQPEMTRIQKLYGNDKARMQMELMKLYQTHKTSPMSGCLPMLIQIPIFFALYKALMVSVQMRNAHFLWISDLSVMDPYFILPILMGVTMWWQQRQQSPAQKNTKADKNDVAATTQRAMKWMPILFTIMFAWMPAGLVLYWTVSNIFGIGQMYYIKRKSDAK